MRLRVTKRAMTRNVLISVAGPDRVGLVAEVTGRLFDLGINLGDTTFAVLGTGCKFSAVAETPEEVSAEELTAQLRALPELSDAVIEVSEFKYAADHAESGRHTHRICVSGGDQPGLVARVSEAFVEFGANIVRLNSERVRGGRKTLYVTNFDVAIPETRAKACLAAVANTAAQLQLECTWEVASGT